MDCQMLTDKINILLYALLYLFYFYCLLWTAGYTFGKFTYGTYAVIASGIQIRDKILEDYAKRTSESTRLTAGAAHLVAPQVAVRGTLQRIMIARGYAGCLFAMPTDSSKCRVFAKISHAVILRVVKITAAGAAFLTVVTDI